MKHLDAYETVLERRRKSASTLIEEAAIDLQKKNMIGNAHILRNTCHNSRLTWRTIKCILEDYGYFIQE